MAFLPLLSICLPCNGNWYEKTDWTPLKGKHIIIWPDNDEPGKRYAENAAKKLLEIGVASLVKLKIPQDRPKGWDAADCVKEGISIEEFLASTPLLIPTFVIGKTNGTRYKFA